MDATLTTGLLYLWAKTHRLAIDAGKMIAGSDEPDTVRGIIGRDLEKRLMEVAERIDELYQVSLAQFLSQEQGDEKTTAGTVVG